jgi:hypothetical protein
VKIEVSSHTIEGLEGSETVMNLSFFAPPELLFECDEVVFFCDVFSGCEAVFLGSGAGFATGAVELVAVVVAATQVIVVVVAATKVVVVVVAVTKVDALVMVANEFVVVAMTSPNWKL